MMVDSIINNGKIGKGKNMRNIILLTLDSVRRDFFYSNIGHDFTELRRDFASFPNCYSLTKATPTSHYTMFFGDYFNRSPHESFPTQLKKFGFKSRSFCNGAIVVSYPVKGIEESSIKDNRPFRDKMIADLGIEPEFEWEREKFGKKFEDFYGAADDKERNIPEKWKDYIVKNKDNKNFLFLHFWCAHYNYGINDQLENKIIGKNYYEIGNELIRRIKKGDLTLDFVRDVYSQRVNEIINIYIRDLIDILKENDMYDDCLIFITSDHGEGLGDSGRDYNEVIFRLYRKVHTLYNRYIRKMYPILPKRDRTYQYKWDSSTFFHGDHDLHKEIFLLVKFPHNEFGGIKYGKKVTLFDIIHTINELMGNKLDIKSNHGTSLYSLLTLGEDAREKYKIKRLVLGLKPIKGTTKI